MAKQQLIKEAFKLQQIAGIKPLYEFESKTITEGYGTSNYEGKTITWNDYEVEERGIDGGIVDAVSLTGTDEDGNEYTAMAEMVHEELAPETIEDIQPVGSIKEADEDEEEDMEDDWNKVEDGDDDYEQEPTKKDIQVGDKAVGVLGGNQSKLQTLISQKDAILNKFKSGEITIDQYKQEIGNIPQQIKNLQAAIEKQMSGDEGEEEEIFESNDGRVWFVASQDGKYVVAHASKHAGKTETGSLRFKSKEEAQAEADKLTARDLKKESILRKYIRQEVTKILKETKKK